MAEFLTPAWADELTELLRSDDTFGSTVGDANLEVRYVVSGHPSGPVAWTLSLRPGGADVRIAEDAGVAGDEHVTIRMSWDVSIALARGEMTMRQGESSGELEIHGDLAAFFRHSAAITCFDQLQSRLSIET
ncbi:MAG: hypothetical protein DYH08_13830 [Actinobacteria bacterium ATB1]|nr:hypothetical protein [Actinobacteria bacterium ATB1]